MAITYNIGFKADTDSLQAQLQAIGKDIQQVFDKSSGALKDNLAEGVKQANILQTVLKQATTDKGTSFINMNLALKQAGSSVQQMITGLSGAKMQGSLNTFLQTFAQADRNLIGISSKIQEMQRVMTQSIKFNMAMAVQNFVSGEIQSAIRWVQDLNKAITDIIIVEPKLAGSMDSIAESIVRGAQELRVAAKDYAEAALIFYQQGLDSEEVTRRTEVTVKSALASGQSMADMADQLTAVWNTYQMVGDEMDRAASIAAKLGAETAAEFKDIAVGMQIAASGASMLGVSYESLSAIMATVVETTKQSASTIGQAYKTIFARFTNLKASGEEGEVELGRIATQLAELGVHVLDADGNLRDLDSVINELGTSWDNYSRKQQIAIAQVVGGVRQYQQFLALMQNFDKYQKNLISAQSEMGTESLDKQFLTAISSIDRQIENSSEAWRRALGGIFETEGQMAFYKIIENIGKVIEEIVNNLGGMKGILLLVGSLLLQQVVPAITKVRNFLVEMWTNRSIASQIEEIKRVTMETKKLMNETAGYTGANRGSTGFDATTAAGADTNFYEKEKVDLAEKAAAANAYLNKIKKDGSVLDKNSAEALQQQITRHQTLAQAALDLLQNYRKRVEQAEKLAIKEKALLQTKLSNLQATKGEVEKAQRNLEMINRFEAAEKKKGKALSDSMKAYRQQFQAVVDTYTAQERSIKAAINMATAQEKIAKFMKDQSSLVGSEGLADAKKQAEEIVKELEKLAAIDIKFDTDKFTDANELAQELANTIAAVQNTEKIEIISPEDIQKMREAAAASSQLEDSTRRLSSLLGQAQSLWQRNGAAIQDFAKSSMKVVSQTAMTMVMLVNTINNLGEKIKDGTVNLGDFVMAVAMVGPMIASLATSMFALAGKIAVSMAASAADTVAKAAEAGAIASVGIAAQIAALPVGVLTAIVMAAMIAIIALIAVIVLVMNAIKKQREEQVRQANAHMEAAKKANDLRDSLVDLRESLRALKTQMAEGTITTEEFTAKMQELREQVEALSKEHPNLNLTLTGDIEGDLARTERAVHEANVRAIAEANAAISKVQELNKVMTGNAGTLDYLAASLIPVAGNVNLVAKAVTSKEQRGTAQFATGFNQGQSNQIDKTMASVGIESQGKHEAGWFRGHSGTYDMVEIAKNYTTIMEDLGGATSELGQKFDAEMRKMDGFVELLNSVDALEIAEGFERYEQVLAKTTFQMDKYVEVNGKLQKQQIDITSTTDLFEAQEDAQKQALLKNEELAEAQKQLALANDNYKKNESKANKKSLDEADAKVKKLQAESDQLHKVAAEYDAIMANMAADSSGAAKDIMMERTARQMLSAKKAQKMRDAGATEKEIIEVQFDVDQSAIDLAVARIKEGYTDLVGVDDTVGWAIRQTDLALSALGENFANWSEGAPPEDKIEWLNKTNAAIEETNKLIRGNKELDIAGVMGLEELPKLTDEWFKLTAAQREVQVELFGITEAQAKIVLAQNNIAVTQDKVNEKMATAKKLFEKDFGGGWTKLVEDIDKLDIDKLDDFVKAQTGLTTDQKEALEAYVESVKNGNQEIIDSEYKVQLAREDVALKTRELYQTAQADLLGMTADDFSGSLIEQQNALDDANAKIELYNEMLKKMGIEGGKSIETLGTEFLLLTDAEKEAFISMNALIMATNDAISAQDKYSKAMKEYNDLRARSLTEDIPEEQITAALKKATDAYNELRVAAIGAGDAQVSMIRGTITSLTDQIHEIGEVNKMLDLSAKKVGDNYKLMADDIDVVKNKYPELLAYAEVTADGQILLNQATVDNFLLGKEAELKAQVEVQKKMMEAQIKELEARRDIIDAELLMIEAAANGDIEAFNEAAKAKGEAEDKRAEYQREIDEYITQLANMSYGEQEAAALAYGGVVADVADDNLEVMTEANDDIVAGSAESADGQMKNMGKVGEQSSSTAETLFKNMHDAFDEAAKSSGKMGNKIFKVFAKIMDWAANIAKSIAAMITGKKDGSLSGDVSVEGIGGTFTGDVGKVAGELVESISAQTIEALQDAAASGMDSTAFAAFAGSLDLDAAKVELERNRVGINKTIGELRAGIADLNDHLEQDFRSVTPDKLPGYHDKDGKGKDNDKKDPKQQKEELIKLLQQEFEEYKKLEAQLKRIQRAQERLNQQEFWGIAETARLAQLLKLQEQELEVLKRLQKSRELQTLGAFKISDDPVGLREIENEEELWNAYNQAVLSAYDNVRAKQQEINIERDRFSQLSGAEQEKQKEAHEETLKNLQKVLDGYETLEGHVTGLSETLDQATKAMENHVKSIDDWYAAEAEIFQKELEKRKTEYERLVNTSRSMYEVQKEQIRVQDRLYDKMIKASQLMVNSAELFQDSFRLFNRGVENRVAQLQNYQFATNMTQQMADTSMAFFDEDGKLETWEKEKLEGIRDMAEATIDELYALNDAIMSELTSVFGALWADIDRTYAKFEQLTSKIESMSNILKLAGYKYNYGEEGRSAQASLAESKLGINRNRLASARQMKQELEEQYKYASEAYEKYLKDGANITDDFQKQEFLRNAKTMQDHLYEMEDKMVDAQQEFMSIFEGTMQDAYNLFELKMTQSIDRLKETIGEKFGAFGSMSLMQDQYDYSWEKEDRYVNQGEQLYQLSQLSRTISEFDTQDAKVLERIKKLQDDITSAKEQDAETGQLINRQSKYDLDVLNERFKLLQLQAEWEDARNAKNTMRLGRDASGNWSYVYSADEKAAEDKGKQVEDQMNKIWQLSFDRQRELADSLMANMMEIATLDQQMLEHANNPEYVAILQRKKEELMERDRYLRDAMDIAVQNSGRIHEDVVISEVADLEYISAMRELGAVNLSDIIGKEMADLLTSEEGHEWLSQVVDQACQEMTDAWIEWEENLKVVVSDAGYDFNTMATDFKTEAEKMKADSDELARKIEETTQRATEAMRRTIDTMSSWATQWWQEASQIIAANQAIIDSINALIAAKAGLDVGENGKVDANWNAIYGIGQGYNYAGQYSSGYEDKYGKNTNISEGFKYGYEIGNEDLKILTEQIASAYNVDPSKVKDFLTGAGGLSYKPEEGGWVKWTSSGYQPPTRSVGENFEAWLKDPKNYKPMFTGGLVRNASGPYSLAEKGPEIVLNSSDTENFLSAIQIMRDAIARHLGTLGMRQSQVIGGIHSATTDGPGEVQPQVIIQADFPNVSARDEIEAAFANLVNQAAQYTLKPRA